MYFLDKNIGFKQLDVLATTDVQKYFKLTMAAAGNPNVSVKYNQVNGFLNIREDVIEKSSVRNLVEPLHFNINIKEFCNYNYTYFNDAHPVYKKMENGVLEIVFRVSLYVETHVKEFDIKNKEHESLSFY